MIEHNLSHQLCSRPDISTDTDCGHQLLQGSLHYISCSALISMLLNVVTERAFFRVWNYISNSPRDRRSYIDHKPTDRFFFTSFFRKLDATSPFWYPALTTNCFNLLKSVVAPLQTLSRNKISLLQVETACCCSKLNRRLLFSTSLIF